MKCIQFYIIDKAIIWNFLLGENLINSANVFGVPCKKSVQGTEKK